MVVTRWVASRFVRLMLKRGGSQGRWEVGAGGWLVLPWWGSCGRRRWRGRSAVVVVIRHAAAEAERVLFVLREGMICLEGGFPQLVEVVGEGGSLWCWSRSPESGVRIHACQLRCRVPRLAVRQRAGAVPLVVDGDGDSVEDNSKAVPVLRFFDEAFGQVMQSHGVSSQVVSLPIELFGRDTNQAIIDALFTEVAGDFFDTKEVRFGLKSGMDALPKISLGTVTRREVSLE